MPTNVLRVNTNNWIVTGAGDPEGRERAPVGSIYLREDGAGGTSLYVKETGGVGYIGWKAMAIPAGGQAPVAHAASHGSGGADPITGPLTLSTPYPQIRLNAAIPMVQWQEVGASADKKRWRMFASGEVFRFDCLNDAENAVTITLLTVARDGAVNLLGALTVNGLVTAPGYIAQGAGVGITILDTAAPADAKRWQLATYNNGQLYLETLNDALNAYQGRVIFDRAGGITAGKIVTGVAGNNLADLTVGATNFTAGIYMTAGNLNLGPGSLVGGGFLQPNGYIYPGQYNNGGAQANWYLAGHGSYGLYCNTGIYIAAHLWTGLNLYVGGSGDVGTSLNVGTTIRAGSGVYERGRGQAMGDWVDEAFNAGRYGFTCYAAEAAYMQIGGTVFQNINITSATVPSASAYNIYTSFNAVRNTHASAHVIVAGGYQPSSVFSLAGTNVVQIRQTSGLNYPAGNMTCQFTVPISV